MSGAMATAVLTVADVMLRHPDSLPCSASFDEVAAVLARPHVHLVLLTDGRRLVGTLDRGDLEAEPSGVVAARELAVLEGRTVGPREPAEALRLRMRAEGIRRLAVVDDDGELLGLLCLKRRGHGFCSDADVRSRRRERRDQDPGQR